MNWTYRQHSFTGGLMDADLMGRQDVENYYKGASRLDNFNVTRQGFLAKRRGSRLLVGNFARRGWQRQISRIIPIVKDNDDGYYLFVNDGAFSIIHPTRGILLWGEGDSSTLSNRVWAKGMLTNAQYERIYRVSKFTGDARVIDYCQIGDTILLASKNFRPMKITIDYVTDCAERPVITVEDIDFGTEKYNDVRATLSSATVVPPAGGWEPVSGTKTVSYIVSYVDTDGYEMFPSAKKSVTYGIPWPEGGKIRLVSRLSRTDQKDNFAEMRFFKNEGSGFGYIGSCTEFDSGEYGRCTFDDDYITPDLTLTPRDEKSRHDFSTPSSNYPHKVSMTNQRVVYARDLNNPFKLWLSCIGLFNEFTTHESVQASDCIDCSLSATEMPRIFHVFNGRELLVFTESGEWIVKPSSGNALTPTTISAKLHSTIGTTEFVKPIMVGNEVLFTDSSSRKLYATAYDLTADSYKVTDMSAMTHFAFDDDSVFSGSGIKVNGIWKIVYRESPDSQVYCLLNDGTVGVLTYNKSHNLMAWSHMRFAHFDDGAVPLKCYDIASNKSVHNGTSEVLMVMLKGNSTGDQIWVLNDENPIENGCDLADAVCLDGMREISYVPGTTTYLPILMTAVGKTTGTVFRSGRLTSQRAVITEDCIAGYPVEARYESVYPDAKNGIGEMQGERMNATDVTVRVCNSSSFKVGQVEHLEERDRTAGTAPVVTVHGSDPSTVELLDGDVKTILAGSNGRDSRIRITHDGPWPLNVMSVAVTYQVEGENLNGGGGDE